jgi:hypothetical protein
MPIKNLTKFYLKKFLMPIDFLLSLLLIPIAYLLLMYRKFGAQRLSISTLLLKKIGVFPIRNHYYEPLFDESLLFYPLDRERFLPGINFNLKSQLMFLKNLSYSFELKALKFNKVKVSNHSLHFYLNNGSFESGDADFLYQIIRFLKPKKVIEIGSGNSTKIAHLALKKNESESYSFSHICIEPFEQPWLDDVKEINLIRERLEAVTFNWENELDAGDLLFIDSSHIIRPQGDVLKLYLEIIPRLKKGVYVHIHDIFSPRDYPYSWIFKAVMFWNEQYLLEALLTNSNRYEIVAALNFMKHNQFKNLSKVCPYLSLHHEPSSFYFKVV